MLLVSMLSTVDGGPRRRAKNPSYNMVDSIRGKQRKHVDEKISYLEENELYIKKKLYKR